MSTALWMSLSWFLMRLWKKFQQVMTLPEKDRRAVIRLVNSLVQAQAALRG